MPANRLNRINEELRRELAALLREVKDPRLGSGLLTVTSCRVTGDLKFCKVYVSTLDETTRKEVMQGLRSASGWLRRELGKRLSLRLTPELIFELDDSIKHGAHISEMLKNISGE